MSIFPGGTPPNGTAVPSDTLAVAGHTALHNTSYNEIGALATKMGTGASTPTANKFLRGNGVGTSAWAQADLTADVTGVLPTVNGGTGGQTNFLAIIYPIGCIYTEITGTNPGTTFGFGTWVQFGQGQVLVGQKPADANFGTVIGTGGEITHTLTSTEMPSHTHIQDSHNHAYDASSTDTSATGSLRPMVKDLAFDRSPQTNSTTATNQNTGGDGAHNNLQPYIVVYFWRRAA